MIQHKFNKSAKQYDEHSQLHQQIAQMLIAQLEGISSRDKILDLGCGTGHLTSQLKEKFPKAKITGLDFAQGMLDMAQSKHNEIEWVLGDIQQLPFEDGAFDVVISNAALQWSVDLIQAFKQIKRILSSDGNLVISIFGFNTCQELLEVLSEVKGLKFNHLPDEKKVQQALEVAGFSDFQIIREEIRVPFKNMQALMAWLKIIGANNLAKEGFIGKNALAQASVLYQNRFAIEGGVHATFEIFYVHCVK